MVVLDPGEETPEDRGKDQSDEGHGDGGDGGPEDKGVPLPEPEAANEFDRRGARLMEEETG